MIETLEEWVEKIKKKIDDSEAVVLVEGINDKKALLKIGVDEVIALDKRPLFEVVEDIVDDYKDCILLVDLDKEGKKMFKKLNSDLSQRGVRVDKSFRNFLYAKTGVRQIENLVGYLANN